MTTFAFDNYELICLLKQRGCAITSSNFKLVRQIDEKINALKIQDQDQQYPKLTRPVSAFMTFENEESFRRAIEYGANEDNIELYAERYQPLVQEKWWNDVNARIDIKQASEPSDIIWENRHVTDWDRIKRAIWTGIVIFLALGLSFIVVFIAKQYSYRMMTKYPEVDCTPYYQNYPSEEQLMPFAI